MLEPVQIPSTIVEAAERSEAPQTTGGLAIEPLHPEAPDAPKFTLDDITKPADTKTPVVTKTAKVNAATQDTKAKQAEATVEPEDKADAEPLPEVDDEAVDKESESDEATEPKDTEPGKIHGNNKRDFSGFDLSEIKTLKGMNNYWFNKLAPVWRELKLQTKVVPELKTQVETLTKQLRDGGVPESWHEHPEAYVLSPEFRAINQEYSRIDFEENFYQQQLAAVKAGSDWQYIKSYDRATGQPILSEVRKASNQDDIWLTQTLGKCGVRKGNLEGRISNIQQTFQGQHQQFLGAVKATTDGFISKLVDKVKPLEPDEKSFEDMLPTSLRQHPLAYAAKRQHGIIMQQARYIEELLKAKTVDTKLANDRKLAGARPSKLPRDPSTETPGQKVIRNGKPVDAMLRIEDIVPTY